MTRIVANHLGLRPKFSSAPATMNTTLLDPTQQQPPTPQTQQMQMQPILHAQPAQYVAPKDVETENEAEAFSAQTLSEVLANANLSQYEEALRDLGCAEVDDLRNLEEADLVETGMKKVRSTQFTPRPYSVSQRPCACCSGN